MKSNRSWRIFVLLLSMLTVGQAWGQAQCADLQAEINAAAKRESCAAVVHVLKQVHQLGQELTRYQRSIELVKQESEQSKSKALAKHPLVKLAREYAELKQSAEKTQLIWRSPRRDASGLAPVERLVTEPSQRALLAALQRRYGPLLNEWDAEWAKAAEQQALGKRPFQQIEDDIGAAYREWSDAHEHVLDKYEANDLRLDKMIASPDWEHCLGASAGALPVKRVPLGPHNQLRDEYRVKRVRFDPVWVPSAADLLRDYKPEDGFAWKLDGEHYALALREAEEAKALAIFEEITSYYAGGLQGLEVRRVKMRAAVGKSLSDAASFFGGMAASSWETTKSVGLGIGRYLYESQKTQLRVITGQASADELIRLATDANADANKFFKRFQPDPNSPTLHQTVNGLLLQLGGFLFSASKGALGVTSNDFISQYQQANAIPKDNAQNNLRAWRLLVRANETGKQALGETTALSTLAAELSLVVMGHAGIEPFELSLKAAVAGGKITVDQARKFQGFVKTLKRPKVLDETVRRLRGVVKLPKRKVAEQQQVNRILSDSGFEPLNPKPDAVAESVPAQTKKQLDNADGAVRVRAGYKDNKSYFDVDASSTAAGTNAYVPTSKDPAYFAEVFDLKDPSGKGVRFTKGTKPSDFKWEITDDEIGFAMTDDLADTGKVEVVKRHATRYRVCSDGDCVIYKTLKEAQGTGKGYQRLDVVDNVDLLGQKVLWGDDKVQQAWNEGVAAMNQKGIINTDLKDANVGFVKSGDGYKLAIVDPGGMLKVTGGFPAKPPNKMSVADTAGLLQEAIQVAKPALNAPGAYGALARWDEVKNYVFARLPAGHGIAKRDFRLFDYLNVNHIKKGVEYPAISKLDSGANGKYRKLARETDITSVTESKTTADSASGGSSVSNLLGDFGNSGNSKPLPDDNAGKKITAAELELFDEK